MNKIWNQLKKRLHKFFSQRSSTQLFLLAALLISLPLTIFLAQQTQEIRQRAETGVTCPFQQYEKVVGCRNVNGVMKTCVRRWYMNTDTNCKLIQMGEDYICDTDRTECDGQPAEKGNFCSADSFPVEFHRGSSENSCTFIYQLNPARNCRLELQPPTDGKCPNPPTPIPNPTSSSNKCVEAGGTCGDPSDCTSPNIIDSSKSCGTGARVGACCISTTCQKEILPPYEYQSKNGLLCFLDVIKSNKTDCLYKETDSLPDGDEDKNEDNKAGFHCDPNYQVNDACLEKIPCFTQRRQCIKNAFKIRDDCYKDEKKSKIDKIKCSDDYHTTLQKCMGDFNQSKCINETKLCYGPGGPPPTTTPAPTSKPGVGGPQPTSKPGSPQPTIKPGSPQPTNKPGTPVPTIPTAKHNNNRCETPGEPVNKSCTAACATGTKIAGGCKGATFCIWTPEGNFEGTDCQCVEETNACQLPKENAGKCEGNLSFSCGGFPNNKLTANWTIENQYGECNVYLRDVNGDHVISKQCNGNWTGTEIPDPKKGSFTNDGHYKLFISNGGNCMNMEKGDVTLNCTGTGPTEKPKLPPLNAPKSVTAVCGKTNDGNKPVGIEVTWDSVTGAKEYAVRIDNLANGWNGDDPDKKANNGDTVENHVKGSPFIKQAQAGTTYRVWVHSVNDSLVYSEKVFAKDVTCPSDKELKEGRGLIGGDRLIILPN